MKTQTKPDPKSGHSILGGTLKEIPRPHVRRFPKYGSRPVDIRIMKFYSIGRHYHVSIHESNNPIWDRKRKAWVTPWSDERGRGRSINEKFNTVEVAEAFVKETVKKNFNGSKYEVSYEGEGKFPKWLYRDGD